MGLQVAEVMARLDQQHAEVEASREQRGVMLEAARKLDAACEDVAWLTAFEQDEDRYKVQCHRHIVTLLFQANPPSDQDTDV